MNEVSGGEGTYVPSGENGECCMLFQGVIRDVMGVRGLNLYKGTASANYHPKGYYWEFNGLSLSEDEVIKKLKKDSIRPLDITNSSEDWEVFDCIGSYFEI